MIQGCWRIGNLNGQGSMQFVGEKKMNKKDKKEFIEKIYNNMVRNYGMTQQQAKEIAERELHNYLELEFEND